MKHLHGTVIIGPDQHGVPILARQIAAHDSAQVSAAPTVTALLVRNGLSALSASTGSVHVHFTDRLFGANCELSVAGFATLAAAITQQAPSAVLSLTLHDVPHRADDPARYARRAAAYRAVVNAVGGRVIVNSQPEADEVQAFTDAINPVVIPLPIECGPAFSQRPHPLTGVGIVGFLYPGKGHAQAIRALGRLPGGVGLIALGRPADGHEHLAAELTALARERGRPFTVTGFLPDAALLRLMRRVAVPLSAHQHISASGSIGSWLRAGRRPLVPDGPWTQELSARCPGAVTRYRPDADGLGAALVYAHAHPDSTWLAADVELGPDQAQVTQLYQAAQARFASIPGLAA